MKKIALLLLFAVLGFVSQAQAAPAMTNQFFTADAAVCSTTNRLTTIHSIDNITCTGAASCYLGFRQYASVSTGPIITRNVYRFAGNYAGGTTGVTANPPITSVLWAGQIQNASFSNGVYADALTGTINAHIHCLK